MDPLAHRDWFPDEPEVAATQIATGPSSLRYEDVSQDGRLMLLALPHSIGDVVWQKLLIHHPLQGAMRAGVIPILSRFVIEGGSGPISVRWPLSASGRFQLAHTTNDDGRTDGQPNHLMLNLWTSLSAPLGRTHGAPPPRAGESVFVGRVLAEHVFTRLFAAPADRKVRRLEAPGVEPIPAARWEWRSPDAALELPPGARALDAEPILDEAPIVFGINHTDSNQHVNSLVYPRLFLDAALRRLAAHGQRATVLAQRLEIAYRKPCFAGQRMRIALKAFVDGDRLGAVGTFVPADDPAAKPHCYLQVVFTD